MRTNGLGICNQYDVAIGDLFINTCSGKIHKCRDITVNNIIVDTNGNKNVLINCRWLTQKEYEDYSKSSNFYKTNGLAINKLQFESMVIGDCFVNVKRSDHIFVFEKYSTDPGVCKDSNGDRNTLKNMRWPTVDEIRRYNNKKLTNNNKTKKEENKMNDNKQIVKNETAIQVAYNTVKSDGTDAAWRVAAKQAAKSVKAPVVAALQRTTLPTGGIGFFVSQFDTDNGEAVLAFVLGTVMGYVPQLGTDPKFIRLARELRVLGMDRFLSKVADVMLNPLREQLVEIVKAIPFETPAV